MNNPTRAFCEQEIREQISILSHSGVKITVQTIDSTSRLSREDLAVETRELEVTLALNSFSVRTQESRKVELEALLEKVEKGQFKPFCLGCGVPITVAMFQAHASEKCPVCRGKHGNTLSYAGAPRRLNSENPLGIFARKERPGRRVHAI